MSARFSSRDFREKLARHALEAGREVVLSGLKLYLAALDARTPAWARGVAFAALAYFISPADAIPDLAPGIGYADDAGVLAAALASLRAHVTAEIARRAQARLREWFSA